MPKRIAITGPESTGKSWLAEKLAAHYNGIWISEYAREYLQKLNRPYQLTDIELIAKIQMELINEAELIGNQLLFADTELLVCTVWADYVFGEIPISISEMTQNQQFDLYLLCDIDLPWVADPLREHPHKREELFARYLTELQKRKWTYQIIRGFNNERLNCGVQAVDALLMNHANV